MIKKSDTKWNKDSLINYLLWRGSRIRFSMMCFFLLFTGLPNLYFTYQKSNPTVFNVSIDLLNENTKSLFLKEFWKGYEKYNYAILLELEGKKNNLCIDDNMVENYIKKKFTDSNGLFNKDQYTEVLKKWNISHRTFQRHVRLKLMAELMDKIIDTLCPLDSLQIPSKIICTAFFLKNPKSVQTPILWKESIEKKSVIAVTAQKGSGYVVRFPKDIDKINQINEHFKALSLSTEEKIRYITSLFEEEEIKVFSLYNVNVDQSFESHMLFAARERALHFNGHGYFGIMEQVEPSHIRESLSEEKIKILQERSNMQMGSLKEIEELNNVLYCYKNNPEKDPSLYNHQDFYQKELTFTISDIDIISTINKEPNIFMLKEGDLALLNTRFSDKAFLVYIKSIDCVPIFESITESYKSNLLRMIMSRFIN